MPNEYRDHSAEFRRRFEREMGRRLDAAAVLVLNHVRQLISVEGTGKAQMTTAEMGLRGKKELAKFVRGFNKIGVYENVGGEMKRVYATKTGKKTFRKPRRWKKKT